MSNVNAYSWFCLSIAQVFCANSYLGYNKILLQQLGDDNTYTQLFTALLPASAVLAPAFSALLRFGGFAWAFGLTSGLGFVWTAVSGLCPLKVQVVAFVAFSCYRALLYSAYFTFLAHSFGHRTMGRVHGRLCVLAACASWLIWPCTNAAQRLGDLRLMSALAALLMVPTALMTIGLARHLRAFPSGDLRSVP